MDETDSAVISCHKISYSVSQKQPCRCCAEPQRKQILLNVDGVFKPGLNAILGATGSGKTSLLDVLAGRKDPRGLTGHILVNGSKQPKNFKCMTGYVVQDDVVMGTLTVRENLMFSANMRLRSEISQEEKYRKVDDIIHELGLAQCADTKVGNEFIRGISGGERKRTNIGTELIVSPSLLFLDEPTSGLDAHTASAVLRLLSRISKKNRTIIFSIHQPRYSIYKLFDKLTFLAKGQVVYHGPATEALDYFSSLGYQCEPHNNPPDFFLDVINGEPTTVHEDDQPPRVDGAKAEKNKLSVAENGVKPEKYSMEEDRTNAIAIELTTQYQQSVWCTRTAEEIDPIFAAFEKNMKENTEVERVHAEYATSFGTQLKYLSKRTITNIARNPATSVLQVLVMIVLAVVAGILFLDQDDRLPEGLQNRIGLFFFTIMNMVFSNMGAIELFLKEKLVFMHENSNGFYRTSSYFVAKVVFDFIPLRVIPVACYSAILYFMVGLVADAGHFFFFMLTLILTSMTAAAVSFAAGASIGIYAVANIMIALIYVLMMIFGGLFVNLDTIWVGIRWLQYFSLFKYSFNAMLINEFKDLKFYSKNQTSGKWEIVSYAGEEYLETQDVDYDTLWDKWHNLMALGIMIIGFLTIAYIQLRRIKKYK